MAPHIHPLDKLITDDRIFLLEAVLPFLDGPMRAPMAVYVKWMELRQILSAMNDKRLLSSCHFNRNINDQNDVLSSLSECGFANIADQMQQMKQAMEMMQVMNQMQSQEDTGVSDTYRSIFEAYDRQTDDFSPNHGNDLQANYAPDESFTHKPPDMQEGMTPDPISNIMELLNDYDKQHGII